jgi:hypothetical protein
VTDCVLKQAMSLVQSSAQHANPYQRLCQSYDPCSFILSETKIARSTPGFRDANIYPQRMFRSFDEIRNDANCPRCIAKPFTHSFLLSMLSFAERICFRAERVYSQNSRNHIHASSRSAKYCVCSGAKMIPIERLGLPSSEL